MTNNILDNKYSNMMTALKIDCKECKGLCCVALYCMKTDGFPMDKEAGKPCRHLASDFRCEIHSKLGDQNYKGCLAYDCFGAGQKTTKICYPDTWKTDTRQANRIFNVFELVFQLHQMLWYLMEAFTLTSDKNLKATIDALIIENEQMLSASLDDLPELNVTKYRTKVNDVLKQITALVLGNSSKGKHRTEYLGQDFKRANLDKRDFSMSLMIAANLEGCSLKKTNFLGTDMRDANLKNTDLSESIFLTQMQINSTKGNLNTKIPSYLSRPATWKK